MLMELYVERFDGYSMGETSREDTIALTRSKIGIYYLRESMGIWRSSMGILRSRMGIYYLRELIGM